MRSSAHVGLYETTECIDRRPADSLIAACSRGTPHDVMTRNPPPWEIIKTWLKACTETHHGACTSLPSEFLPSRLLYVGTLSEPTLRIQLRDQIQEGTRYLTLSHCWGPIVPKRLLLESLDEFRRYIPTDGLSRTFQDAIYATRKLGMEHLWIDSLCIIQNSAEEYVNLLFLFFTSLLFLRCAVAWRLKFLWEQLCIRFMSDNWS
jgi:hypothetical protein